MPEKRPHPINLTDLRDWRREIDEARPEIPEGLIPPIGERMMKIVVLSELKKASRRVRRKDGL